GLQTLGADGGLRRAGIVLGLEVSRLARNSTDWHRLLEICALTDTLILDEDGLYDPAHFNDRLLLGLKGTMSEAELHVLRARLRGGVLNKARRGELESPLPIGFVYGSDGRVQLDPARQRRSPAGGCRFQTLPRAEWIALVPGAHDGYIAWDAYEENQRRLRENSQAHGVERRKSPPREGPALLQGLVLCGVCGERMTVR